MSSDLKEAWKDLNVPFQDNGCIQCGKKINKDGSEVSWRCAGCHRLVCRECTLCVPGLRGYSVITTFNKHPDEPDAVKTSESIVPASAIGEGDWSSLPSPGGNEYMFDTLCSLACWERIGKPEE